MLCSVKLNFNFFVVFCGFRFLFLWFSANFHHNYIAISL